MNEPLIPFNRASFDGNELTYAQQAIAGGHTAGNGPFTLRAEHWLESIQGQGKALLTTSCTHALEMTARLINLGPDDEVIVPAYTFVSTASSYVWNGAKPVFADVRLDTLNLDPVAVERLINKKTKAINIVHYGGVGAEPDVFRDMADAYDIHLIEDNAHGLGATYSDQVLGTFGSMSTLSFHETKNMTCGEGGALILNDPTLIERAEILREKGTDRSRFLRGQVDKYTWVDIGSSWVMSDILAAILVGQLERFEEIQASRMHVWDSYLGGLTNWANDNEFILPKVPVESSHPAHMFALRLHDLAQRDRFITHMRTRGVMSVFHYQSLDRSPAGKQFLPAGHRYSSNSDIASETLVRLPLFANLSPVEIERVIDAAISFSV